VLSSGSFATVDFSTFGDEFVDCVENIEFDVRKRKRQEAAARMPNMTLNEEFMYLMNRHCGPLLPFAGDSANSPLIPFDVWRDNMPVEAKIVWSNSTEARAMRFVFSNQLRQCMTSVALARSLELVILGSPNPYDEIVPRLWLYDTFAFANATYQMARTLIRVAQFEYARFQLFADANATIPTWFQWLSTNYVNDSTNVLITRGGWWLTRLSSTILYNTTWVDQLMAGNMSRTSSNLIIVAQKFVSTTMTSLRAAFGRNGLLEQSGIAWNDLLNRVGNTSAPLAVRNMRNWFVRTTCRVRNIPSEAVESAWWKRAVNETQQWPTIRRLKYAWNQPRIQRALAAPQRMLNRILARKQWNNALWAPILVNVASSSSGDNSTITTAAAAAAASVEIAKRDNLLGIDLCAGNACIECTYFERVVDDIIDLFFMCSIDAQLYPIVVNGSDVISSSSRTQRTLSWYSLFSNISNFGGGNNTLAPLVANGVYPLMESVHKLYLTSNNVGSVVTSGHNNGDGDGESTGTMHELDIILDVEQYYGISAPPPGASLRRRAVDNGTFVGQQANARAAASRKLRLLVDQGFTITGWLFSHITSLIDSIFGTLDIRETLDTAVLAVLNNVDDPDATSGFAFWFRFLRRCDYFDHPRCNVGRRGLGLGPGLGYALLVFGGITAIVVSVTYVPVVGPFANIAAYALPLIWLFMFVPVWQSFAYFMSPMCVLVSPLPILPNCLADDLYVGMREIAVPCTNYDALGLPGLTASRCPPPWSRCVSLSDFRIWYNVTDPALLQLPGRTGSGCPTGFTYAGPYERVFVDCSQAPYRFVDGFRNFFFFMRTTYPDAYDSLIGTQFAPARFLLDLTFISRMSRFDFGPSGAPNDTWHSCHKLTSPNWFSLTLTIGASATALAIVASLALVTLVIFYFVILALSTLWASMISTFTRYRWDTSQIDARHHSSPDSMSAASSSISTSTSTATGPAYQRSVRLTTMLPAPRL
jgi:hypothetical protein